MNRQSSGVAAATALLLLTACSSTGSSPPPPAQAPAASGDDVYDRDTIFDEAGSFFGEGAEGLADVLNKALNENGLPRGYIKGNEAGGALAVGVRYGEGILHLKNGGSRQVHWTGPSIGFDVGGNAAKVFALIYGMPDIDYAFRRFPGVDGSLYFVGGVGLNYNRADGITLAPIRFGVGWRQGISVGYMHVTRQKTWVPF